MPHESANFDRIIDRSEVPTLKFDGDMMESIFGGRDLWPSRVADMDFAASEKIQDALARRVSHGVFGYESSGGTLSAAVAAWYRQGNVDTLRTFLRENIPSVRLVEPEGTHLLWLDFRELGLDARQLETFLVQQVRIAGNPGHWFGLEGAGFARIDIACPRSRLIRALENLGSAVDRL